MVFLQRYFSKRTFCINITAFREKDQASLYIIQHKDVNCIVLFLNKAIGDGNG